MHRVLALALTCLYACAHAASPSTSANTPQEPVSEVDTDAPEVDAADYATDPREGGIRGPASDEELVRIVSWACERNGLTLDGRLGQLAEAVAKTSHGASRAPSFATVAYHARLAGIVEPTPEVWVASGPDTLSLEDALNQAFDGATRSSRLTQCGAAAIRHGRAVVVGVALSGRFLKLVEPIPQRVDAGQSVRIKGSIASQFSKPMLAVTTPSGKVERHELPRKKTIDHALDLSEHGEYTVEVLAESERGVSVLAIMKVAAGIPLRLRAPSDDDGPSETSPEAVAAKLAELVAAERKKRGLLPLAIDDRVAEVARRHSQDMVQNHFIAHTSPTTGSATDRVQAARLRATVVLENIGRGYSAQEIHEGLMESPGHRGNILHPEARELGIGVVAEQEGDRLAFVATEVYTKLARDIDVAKAADEITTEVSRRRDKARAPKISLDPGLTRIAQRAAERYASGDERREGQLLDAATREVKTPPKNVRAVVAALVLADDLEQVWSNPRLSDPALSAMGIGIAKLKSSEKHQFALVLLLGMSK